SHDRWFLDRTCTHILAWEGTDEDESKWYFFEGNFSDYEKNKIARLGVDAARPHRVTHRKLTRDCSRRTLRRPGAPAKTLRGTLDPAGRQPRRTRNRAARLSPRSAVRSGSSDTPSRHDPF